MQCITERSNFIASDFDDGNEDASSYTSSCRDNDIEGYENDDNEIYFSEYKNISVSDEEVDQEWTVQNTAQATKVREKDGGIPSGKKKNTLVLGKRIEPDLSDHAAIFGQ